MGYPERYELLHLIIEGKIKGKKDAEDPGSKTQENASRNHGELFGTAVDKITKHDYRANRSHQEEINKPIICLRNLFCTHSTYGENFKRFFSAFTQSNHADS